MRNNTITKKIIIFAIFGLVVINIILYSSNHYTPNPNIRTEESPKTSDKINYFVHYGTLNSQVIATAKKYDLVVLHPINANLRRSDVHKIQQGIDKKDPSDDVKVLAYISIGEDLRTASLTDEVLKSDPNFYGDKSGPRVDPRGDFPNGNPNLDGIPAQGSPSPSGTGYASYYLDDVKKDGHPDRNENFKGCFVNAGDPKWFDAVNGMRLDSPDKLAGLREILSLDYGRGLGCDGVFLDTVDTCAPNQFTSPEDNNQTEYEWTAPGFNTFIRRLKREYPDALVLQNRGLYFFNPDLPHYKYTTGPYIDYLLFESYRLNSNTFEAFSPIFFPDNKYNYAPRIMAEAHRGKGFKVLSLGYAEGPPTTMSTDTLVGKSRIGFDSLMTDIDEAVYQAGFNHYITNAALTQTNTFVMDHLNLWDDTPPVWGSTFNDNTLNPATKPTPRIGIQEAYFQNGFLVVKWDIAMDMFGVDYALYVQELPFDFKNGPELSKARKIPLSTGIGDHYAEGTATDRYAYQDAITDLDPSKTYYMVIRATDRSPNRNEDKNTTVIRIN